MELRRDHQFNPFDPSPEHQAILDSVPDFDHGDFDYNDPATIASLTGMPAPPTMDPAALQQRARAMVNDIFKDFATLQNICRCKLNHMGLHSSTRSAQLAYSMSTSNPP